MRKVIEISPTQDHRPIELRHLRVAAYCQVGTELEEQTSSIELQERHYRKNGLRAGGCSLGAISNWLYESKVPSPAGEPRWSREAISKVLKNEKYVGDILLQKTFVADPFSGKQVKNHGELESFLIQEHHPAIVSRERFETVNQARKTDP